MAQWDGGKPAYVRIANELRDEIISGSLPVGSKIPSESELMRRFDVSRTVARMAIRVLQNESWIVGHPGKGNFVRSRTRIRRDAESRYSRKRAASTSPFKSDAAKAGKPGEWDFTTNEEPASDDVARRLEIAPGSRVIRTAYKYYSGGQVIQLSTSYEPWEITGGTEIEKPEEGPVVGVIARMDRIGHHITKVIEQVNARSALPEESVALDLPQSGGHVFTIIRTHYAGNRPVESCDIVIPEDRYELIYTIHVD